MPTFVYCDGGCTDNPGGIATYGWAAFVEGSLVGSGRGVAAIGDEATNNVAEYMAIQKSLDWLLQRKIPLLPIHVHSDSQLVIRQLQGRYKVRSKLIKPLYENILKVYSKNFHDKLIWFWIPREANKYADKLARLALVEFHNKNQGKI